jgi:hypothetical protein
VTQIYLATAGHRVQHETRQGKASEFRSLHSCSSLILTASCAPTSHLPRMNRCISRTNAASFGVMVTQQLRAWYRSGWTGSTASVTSVGWPVRSRVGSVGSASLVSIPAGDVAGGDLLATKMGGMPDTGGERGGRARLSIF